MLTITLAGICAARFLGPEHHLDRWDYAGHPLAGTVDDPVSIIARPSDLMTAPDFRFKIGAGSGQDGYNTVEIRSDGSCKYTFYDWVPVWKPDGEPVSHQRWRRIEFTIDEKTSLALRKLLVDVDFLRLKKAYYTKVVDGGQEWAMVEVGGKRKIVYCDNHFPASFRKVRRFIFAELIRAHENELQHAAVFEGTRENLESELRQ